MRIQILLAFATYNKYDINDLSTDDNNLLNTILIAVFPEFEYIEAYTYCINVILNFSKYIFFFEIMSYLTCSYDVKIRTHIFCYEKIKKKLFTELIRPYTSYYRSLASIEYNIDKFKSIQMTRLVVSKKKIILLESNS